MKTVVAGATAGGLALAAGPAAANGPTSAAASRHRTRLVLLGTAGGPIIGGERAGISTAIVYDSQVYVVDLGIGSLARLAQAGLGSGAANGVLNNIRGIFFTHMHSDHLAEWPTLYGIGGANALGRTLPPIEVFGPGDRGTLPLVNPPTRPTPDLVNPGSPTPGLLETTGYIRQAWANDLNDRIRDSNFADSGALYHVNEIDVAGVWAVDPAGKPPRLAAPLQVWRDGDVTITATLVDHHPTAPAFAYRFDTPDGSIVVSGDTTVSENLIDLARDCDYLVHEVIDPVWVDAVMASLPAESQEPAKAHLLNAHTTIEQVGRDVAQPAGAKNLVLTHLVGDDSARWREAQRGYDGRLIVGEDLQQFGVGRPRRDRRG